MAVIPKKAATVILLREGNPQGFEVFLLKRHEKSSFMGGNFVYPGGRVDRDDGSSEICSLCKGISPQEAHQILGGSIAPDESIAHWVAGIRELFEEAGVLLAYDRKGNPLTIQNSIEQERFLNYRGSLQKKALSLLQLAREEKLLFALDRLYYYAHWITPEARSERFDTRFFLACHPEGQQATYDHKETTIGVWSTPQKALEENLKGEVALSPPTLKTLEDLARFKSVKEVLNSVTRDEIRPVLPVLTKVKDEALIVFPWDPEYEMFQKGELPSEIHARPSCPQDNTTRLILRKGCWIPYCLK
jgi:8-oxo-dGTP pyrophosphatase MutT (NUDIX family)